MFDVINSQTPRLCPACGLPGYFTAEAWDADGKGVIGTGICPCCFYEPGFDDDPAASAEAQPTVRASILHYRAKWIAMGMPWRGNDDYWLTKPAHWNPTAQLDALYDAEPELKG
jgi:hypothetical protein